MSVAVALRFMRSRHQLRSAEQSRRRGLGTHFFSLSLTTPAALPALLPHPLSPSHSPFLEPDGDNDILLGPYLVTTTTTVTTD